MCLFFNNSATCRSGPFYLFNKNKILILKKNHETIAAKACMGAGEEIAGKLRTYASCQMSAMLTTCHKQYDIILI
jgi:hypothetical protein